MSAEVLRKAAALMREVAGHANADHKAPWRHGPMLDPDNNGHFVAYGKPEDDYDNTVAVVPYDYIGATAEHIASWHPAVALAVAAWLEAVANRADQVQVKHMGSALAVATAYLGSDA